MRILHTQDVYNRHCGVARKATLCGDEDVHCTSSARRFGPPAERILLQDDYENAEGLADEHLFRPRKLI